MYKQYVKTFSDSYLYNSANYSRDIFHYIMSADVIDKKSEAFSDILYQVKVRQINPVILKVLMSDKVLLCIAPKSMPRPFKVFRAINVKEGRRADKKIFIDCTGLIQMDGGVYRCKQIGVLLSYLISAMVSILYYEMPDKVVRNATLTESGTEAFIDMMLYVLGYLNVPITYHDNKEKMAYVIGLYYQRCILCKTDMNSISQVAKKLSKLDAKKAEYLNVIFGTFFGDKDYVNINDFIKEFARIFLNQEEDSKDKRKLDIDTFTQRWMYAFGPGTYMGTELFPVFSSILTDCYVGAYINQQNTIEKIVRGNVAEFTTALLSLGSDNA